MTSKDSFRFLAFSSFLGAFDSHYYYSVTTGNRTRVDLLHHFASLRFYSYKNLVEVEQLLVISKIVQ